MRNIRRLIQVSLALITLALPLATHADVVTSFHSDITVSRDNVVSVKETITYEPQDGSHHGIFRFVPAQFKDAAGHTYYTRIKFLSVTAPNGTGYNIADTHNNRTELYLKIGDPKVYLTGPTTYIISYQISPLVVKVEGVDRLILNITGQQWDTVINDATTTVNFEGGHSITDGKCYTGASGSTASDCTVTFSGAQASVATNQPLADFQGLSVDLHTQPGNVSTYLLPDHPVPLSSGEKAAMVLIGLGGLISLLTLIRVMWASLSEWRQRRGQTIIAQYASPDHLHPAELSMLESPAASTGDITATIIDLSVRGYITVKLVSPKSWFAQANYSLTKLKPFDDLDDFEQVLSNALFASESTIEIKDLRNRPMIMTEAIKAFRDLLGKDLKAKGYYSVSPTNAETSLPLTLAFGSLGVLALAGFMVFNDISGAMAVLVGGLLAGLLGFGLTFIKTGRTPLGNLEWAKVEGFKLFLNVTEKDRLNFTDAPERTPELFSALLPYAIALGVEKQWAAQFTGIDVSQAVGGWYGGYSGALVAGDFTSSFASSFSSAVSSSFAGASGGGSAGGGGGGGGGGGW